MNTDKKSIRLIELMPYGSFPVGAARQDPTDDLQSIASALVSRDTDNARFWFDFEDVEVA